MLIVGYCMGIRSERRLCEDVHLNLAYRWFCRLDLSDPVPDHSTFSKNRHGRFRDSDLFRHLFEQVLERCIVEGLIGGDQFGVDASLIKADASRYTKVEAQEWSPPVDAPRAVQKYLDTLDDAAFGGATAVKPKTLSPSDPGARYTRANGDRAFFAYSTNYLVDLENAVIVPSRACKHALPGRGCRSDRADPTGRSGRGARDDPSGEGPLRPLSRNAGRRHGLWLSRHAGLAG